MDVEPGPSRNHDVQQDPDWWRDDPQDPDVSIEDDCLDRMDEDEFDEFAIERLFGSYLTIDDAINILDGASLILKDGLRDKHRDSRLNKLSLRLATFLTGESEFPHHSDFKIEDKNVDPDYEPEYELDSRKRFKLSTVKRILDMYDGRINGYRYSLKSIMAQYKWFDGTKRTIERMRRFVEMEGNWFTKLEEVNKRVLEKFTLERNQGHVVHDRSIQMWAARRAEEIEFKPFSASRWWLHHFKRRHSIVSRKVTLYTSKAELNQQEQRIANMEKFVNDYYLKKWTFNDPFIWNVDQTGFSYEITNLRTLSFAGERTTSLNIQSHNDITHSYTIQPLISRDGHIVGPLLICLKENTVNGEFGPRIGPHMKDLEAQYKNIKIISSKSGKMSSNLIRLWIKDVLKPAVQDSTRHYNSWDIGVNNSLDMPQQAARVLLLADSWSGHSSETIIRELEDIGVETLRIPPHTTAELQPIDVTFNRQYKSFIKRIYEEAIVTNQVSLILSRDSRINMHSLVWDQLNSTRYRDLLRWAWRHTDVDFSNDELDHKIPETVSQVQFSFHRSATCQIENCTNDAFIQCSHCGELLCLRHFLNRTHFHHDDHQQRVHTDVEMEIDDDHVHLQTNPISLYHNRSLCTCNRTIQYDDFVHDELARK